MSPAQFEALVVAIVLFLLGAAGQGFTTGPDGGRDAKFVGTAELLPSARDPWQGTVIGQAKRANGFHRSFSDAEFHCAKSDKTVLGKEIPRIKGNPSIKLWCTSAGTVHGAAPMEAPSLQG